VERAILPVGGGLPMDLGRLMIPQRVLGHRVLRGICLW
jgi:hypothetical protein